MTTKHARHSQAPWPMHPAVPFAQVDNFLAAIDYALSSFHLCVDRALSEPLGRRERWHTAALAYLAVYDDMAAQGILAPESLERTREQLARANACAAAAGFPARAL